MFMIDKDLDLDKVIEDSIKNSTLNEIKDITEEFHDTKPTLKFNPDALVGPTITPDMLRGYMSLKPWSDSEPTPPTFELNGDVTVNRIRHRFANSSDEEEVKLPIPVMVPKDAIHKADVGEFIIIKELSKHFKEYQEVLQILASKNIFVKGHFGTNNVSFSLTDEEIDIFMSLLEKLNKDKSE